MVSRCLLRLGCFGLFVAHFNAVARALLGGCYNAFIHFCTMKYCCQDQWMIIMFWLDAHFYTVAKQLLTGPCHGSWSVNMNFTQAHILLTFDLILKQASYYQYLHIFITLIYHFFKCFFKNFSSNSRPTKRYLRQTGKVCEIREQIQERGLTNPKQKHYRRKLT